jgi:hypothetical protein
MQTKKERKKMSKEKQMYERNGCQKQQKEDEDADVELW